MLVAMFGSTLQLCLYASVPYQMINITLISTT